MVLDFLLIRKMKQLDCDPTLSNVAKESGIISFFIAVPLFQLIQVSHLREGEHSAVGISYLGLSPLTLSWLESTFTRARLIPNHDFVTVPEDKALKIVDIMCFLSSRLRVIAVFIANCLSCSPGFCHFNPNFDSLISNNSPWFLFLPIEG